MVIKKELVKKFYLEVNPNENKKSYDIEIINFKLSDNIIHIKYNRIPKYGNSIIGEYPYSYGSNSKEFWDWLQEYLKKERNSKLNEILK